VVAAAGHEQVLFDIFVGLHVACAVIGFGAVAISGSYGASARHLDRPGAAEETQRYFRSEGWAELLIILVPVFGLGALEVKPSAGGFGDVWVIAALAIWSVAVVLLLGVVRPAERRIRSGRSIDASMGGTRLMWAAIGCDVAFVAALVLMVAQPR
jgi:hypothetical protein